MRYTCQRCREEVSVHEQSGLSHLARARLAAHLDACSSCRSYATMLESARALTPFLSPGTREAILTRVWARREPALRRRQIPGWRATVWFPAASLLASLALVCSGMEIARTPPSRDAPREFPRAPEVAAQAGHPMAAPAPPDMPSGHDSAPSTAGATVPIEGPGPAVATGSRPVRRSAAPAARAGRGSTAPEPSADAAPSPAGDLLLASHAASLYAEAERALGEERPAWAARILEQLVEGAPEGAEAQAARLELGRLYAGPLRDPARAVVHLSAFIAREPEPSARSAARGLLCRLLSAAERRRVCWPGLVRLVERE